MKEKEKSSGEGIEIRIEIDEGHDVDEINKERLLRFVIERIIGFINIDPDTGAISFEPEI